LPSADDGNPDDATPPAGSPDGGQNSGDAPQSSELESAQSDTVADSQDQTSTGCASKQHWIEIKLQDQDGNPIPNEAYLVTGPDGDEHSGNLDDQGFVHIDGLSAGTCTVAFPT
jgi:hypothetical protein